MKKKVDAPSNELVFETHLGPRNRITLPIEMVRAAGFSAGDEFDFSMEDGKVVMQKKEIPLV